jgi:hypothetical protein
LWALSLPLLGLRLLLVVHEDLRDDDTVEQRADGYRDEVCDRESDIMCQCQHRGAGAKDAHGRCKKKTKRKINNK